MYRMYRVRRRVDQLAFWKGLHRVVAPLLVVSTLIAIAVLWWLV